MIKTAQVKFSDPPETVLKVRGRALYECSPLPILYHKVAGKGRVMMDREEGYQVVVADIDKRREEITKELLKREPALFGEYLRWCEMRDRLIELEKSKANTPALISSPRLPANSGASKFFRKRTYGQTTLGDGSEKILREKHPLHASVLVERLAASGRQTNIKSLNSTLLQDPRARFKLLGGNIFTLTEFFEEDKRVMEIEALLDDSNNSVELKEGHKN